MNIISISKGGRGYKVVANSLKGATYDSCPSGAYMEVKDIDGRTVRVFLGIKELARLFLNCQLGALEKYLTGDELRAFLNQMNGIANFSGDNQD